MFTQGMYATKLVAKLDTNRDQAVQLSEILEVVGSDPPGGFPRGPSDGPKPKGGPTGRVTLDDIRKVCPDELKVCEEHENNCNDEIKMSLSGALKGPRSAELHEVIKCWSEKDPRRNPPRKAEL